MEHTGTREGTDGVWIESVSPQQAGWGWPTKVATMGRRMTGKQAAQGGAVVALLLGVAGGLGWLAAQAGAVVALRAAAAGVLPGLLLGAVVSAHRARRSGLAVVLVLALWVLAGAGLWWLAS